MPDVTPLTPPSFTPPHRPPPLPPVPEFQKHGTAHPYWRSLTTWILGGGCSSSSSSSVGSSKAAGWLDVQEVLSVFDGAELRPRLRAGAVPLDLVRGGWGVTWFEVGGL